MSIISIIYFSCKKNNSNDGDKDETSAFDKAQYSDTGELIMKLRQYIPVDSILKHPEKIFPDSVINKFSDITMGQRKEWITKYLDGANLFRLMEISARYSLPILKSAMLTHKTAFRDYYTLGINSGIKNENMKVRWLDIVDFLDTGTIKNSDNSGVGLYYCVNTSVSGNKRFSYVVAKATVIDGDTILPSAYGGNYALLTASGITPINSADFNIYHTYYKSNVKFRKQAPMSTLGTFDLTLICFHSGKKFYQFYQHNKDTFNTIGNVYLAIENGVKMERHEVDPGVFDTVAHQAPLLYFFEDDGTTVKTYLDDIPHDGLLFKNKALDFGRLCPPECPK